MICDAACLPPYFSGGVFSELSAKVEYIKVRLQRLEDLLNNTNTAQNRDFQELRKGGYDLVEPSRMYAPVFVYRI